MNLKTFTGRNMQETLALARRSLGEDAVVLHTRSYRRGGILGFGATTVVEITAADQATMQRSRAQKQRQNTTTREPRPSTTRSLLTRPTPRVQQTVAAPSVASPASTSSTPKTAQTLSTGDLIRRTYAVAMAEMSRKQATTPEAVATPVTAAPASPRITPARPLASTPAPAPVPPVPPVLPLHTSTDQLTQEMQATRHMVAQMMRRQRTGESNAPANNTDLPAPLFDQYLAMLKAEVAEELAEEILAEVKAALSPEELADANRVNDAVTEAIARHLPVDEDAGKLLPTPDHRPRTIALIGPTGVGKTTTLAKLAASFKLKQQKKVGLITLDTYRIAAVEQLRTYAQIIGVPLRVASNVDELLDALRQCRAERCEVILIDTAGRSQRDDPRLEQLATLINAADPHEVHLVLSSTCAQGVLMETAQRFSRIRTDRIIFTKLDEAVSFGVLLNVARKVNKRLSFITTGQEVPHHIEPGQAQRLAALVMGRGTVRC